MAAVLLTRGIYHWYLNYVTLGHLKHLHVPLQYEIHPNKVKYY